MKRKKEILIGLGIITLTVAIYGYQEYTRRNIDLAYGEADYNSQVKTLIKEFEENEKAANEKFLDKIIAVTGVLKEIIKDDKGYYTAVMGDVNSMLSIRCSMDSDHQHDSALLKEGNNITIKGICTGFNADELLGSDVILNRCIIQKAD